MIPSNNALPPASLRCASQGWRARPSGGAPEALWDQSGIFRPSYGCCSSHCGRVTAHPEVGRDRSARVGVIPNSGCGELPGCARSFAVLAICSPRMPQSLRSPKSISPSLNHLRVLTPRPPLDPALRLLRWRPAETPGLRAWKAGTVFLVPIFRSGSTSRIAART